VTPRKYFARALGRTARNAVRDACDTIGESEIDVRVYNAVLVVGDDLRVGFALFCPNGKRPTIHMAGRLPAGWGDDSHLRRHLVESVFHEFVHYEQWAGRRAPTEKGVAVRVRGLMRTIGLRPLPNSFYWRAIPAGKVACWAPRLSSSRPAK
jgi:hypothetical protein